MPILNNIVALLSKLPPVALELMQGLVNSVLSAKTTDEAVEKLRLAALAAGYKKAARVVWRETLRETSKVK
jgi:endonuclease III